MNNTSILLAVALTVGAAAGYLAGRNTSGSAPDESGDGQSMTHRVRAGERSDLSSVMAERGARAGLGKRDYQDINRIPGSSDRIQAMVDFYKQLTIEQLEEEARKLDSLPMNERMMASLLLFGRWGEVDPSSAMAFSNTMGWAGMFVRPTVLKSWASVDPVNAAKYYEANPREFSSMGGRRGFMNEQGGASIIASEWAKQDPKEAMQWALTLDKEKDGALAGVLGEVAKTDPVQAAAMLATVDSTVAGAAYRRVAEAYGTSDFAAARAWIQSLPADEQGAAMASAISGLAKVDAAAAATQAAMLDAGGAKDQAVHEVVGVMARDNAPKAAEFLSQNGSVEAQERAMRDLIPAWVAQDPDAALSYASELPVGDVRDRALRSYVWSDRTADPSSLVYVAESITNERDRSRTVGMMVGRWLREDEAAARAYLDQSTAVSERMKEHILEHN